jgi:hypothetical protein
VTHYTTKDRRGMLQVFKQAKRLVDAKIYICHAIHATCEPALYQRLSENLIVNRLDGEFTLESWLHMHHKPLMKLPNDGNERYAKYRATRHAWLDALIVEFSS